MSASDVAELNQLAVRYAAAVDACDAKALSAVFTPDGRMRVYHPGQDVPFADMRGSTELGTVAERMHGQYRATAHLMTNHLVEVDGDRATGSVLCTARHLAKEAGAGDVLNVITRYVERYHLTESGWRIDDRQIRFLWSERSSSVDSGFS